MKIAVVGLGTIGKVHVRVLQELGIPLGAVCDVDENVLKEYPSAEHFTNYTEMLEEYQPDAVHICTPHYLHAPMVLAALKRNIHVLCEKPLCINEEELQEILEAEKSSLGKLGVCHQNRYRPENVFVKELLHTCKANCGYATVVWQRGAEYYNQAAWRGRKSQEGGGVLINQALHTLDLLVWYLGEPSVVSANTANFSLQNIIEVEDTVQLIASGGADFVFFATNGAKNSFPVFLSLSTEKGLVTILPDKVLIGSKEIVFDEKHGYYGKWSYGVGHKALIDDFYRCLSAGTSFAINGVEASKVLRVIFFAYKHSNV